MKFLFFFTRFDSLPFYFKDAVVVAIGNIGSSKTGLTLLHASGCLKSFMELYNAASGPFKLTCLQTMSCLLSVW